MNLFKPWGNRPVHIKGHERRLPRFSDTPKIEAVILDRKDLVSAGAGECPCCAVGGAIANAIFNATGVRLRALPLVPNGMPK